LAGSPKRKPEVPDMAGNADPMPIIFGSESQISLWRYFIAEPRDRAGNENFVKSSIILTKRAYLDIKYFHAGVGGMKTKMGKVGLKNRGKIVWNNTG